MGSTAASEHALPSAEDDATDTANAIPEVHSVCRPMQLAPIDSLLRTRPQFVARVESGFGTDGSDYAVAEGAGVGHVRRPVRGGLAA